ncbi:MAG: pitrilysin family protein [Myxococcota bacterium]
MSLTALVAVMLGPTLLGAPTPGPGGTPMAPQPPPKLLPAPPANLPAASRYELPNGLRVVLIENHAAPWLEVELGFRVGSASDPVGKEGLASLTGEMLTGGIPGQDEQALAESLARLGATIDAEVETDQITVSGHVLTIVPADARRFMELFASVALDATLPEDVLARQKTLRLAGIQRLVDNPEALADTAMHAACFAGLPEARPTFGTLTAIPAITRDDVVGWRDRAFVAAHGVLVVAGAIDKEAMLAWIAQRFAKVGEGVSCERQDGALPGRCTRLSKGDAASDPHALVNPMGLPRAKRRAEVEPPPSIVLVSIDEPMAQIQWRYGAPNPFAVTHPDWGAFRLGTHVLGGEFNSRLNAILRAREGLTYGAYFATNFGGWDSSAMYITTDATTDALARSIELGVAEWERMAAEPVPKQELEDTRSTLVNGFPFRFETVSDVLGQYSFVELADVPWSWLGTWVDAVRRYDAKAVQTAFQAAEAASNPHLVVVGPPSLAPVLTTLGAKLGGKSGPWAVKVVPVQDFLAHGLAHGL